MTPRDVDAVRHRRVLALWAGVIGQVLPRATDRHGASQVPSQLKYPIGKPIASSRELCAPAQIGSLRTSMTTRSRPLLSGGDVAVARPT